MAVDAATFRPDLFQGRTVLVVGGTGGIGGAVADQFGRLGARVIAAGLPGPGPGPAAAEVVELDLSRPDELEQLITGQDRLDVLINGAGMIRHETEYQPDVFAQVLEVNLTGTLRGCVAAHPLLAASGGSIINVASMWSFFGGARVPGYTASKGGVAQLTKALAVRWAADGVRVNAVAPGWIHTDMTAQVRSDPEVERRILDRTPLARWGAPEEVAEVITFLASPAARFITGTVLPVDGGYHAS
ncbi:SDR family NAD(P)-dependent oxidoreductase [Microlunatus speluncae]|uniref:SDR family NAD(P)-dependent oxidoreductase n=1 Tax=Microlunatus speluncae TaxID=2594267 RepID=UPI001C2DD927|nr:SDR family oxidoreductase [Microlunatus speluncae]